MGFFSEIISATVKTVTTPIAIVKDVVNVAIGEEPDATKKHIESVGDDVKKAADGLADGEML
jgi:hypothetical protein